MFNTFGDSHCKKGWNKIKSKNIKINKMGPLLCYSFGNEGLNRINISNKKYGVKNNDFVCFCLGEIDCRCQVNKYINDKNTYKNIIDNIIKNYFISIQKNEKLFDKLNICVFNVVPIVQKNKIKCDMGKYSVIGSDDDRKKYVEYFNKCLEQKCEEYGYIFFDVYNKYTDKNGFFNIKLKDNNIHINNNIYIVDFLKKINFIF